MMESIGEVKGGEGTLQMEAEADAWRAAMLRER